MSEIYLEVLDDAPNEIREVDDTSVPTLEITVHKEVEVYELTVQEFLEISELGPTGPPGPEGPPGTGTGGGSISDLPVYSTLEDVQADVTSGALVDGDFLLLES